MLKTTVFVLLVLSLPLSGFPYLILQATSPVLSYDIGPWRWSGLLLLLPGLCWFLYTMFSMAHFGKGTPAPFDPPTKLITRGTFRIVRNPAYLGAITILTGESVVLQSYGVLLYACVLWTFFHCFVVFYEEPGLKRRFGAPYLEYLRTVPRWIPRQRRPDASSASRG